MVIDTRKNIHVNTMHTRPEFGVHSLIHNQISLRNDLEAYRVQSGTAECGVSRRCLLPVARSAWGSHGSVRVAQFHSAPVATWPWEEDKHSPPRTIHSFHSHCTGMPASRKAATVSIPYVSSGVVFLGAFPPLPPTPPPPPPPLLLLPPPPAPSHTPPTNQGGFLPSLGRLCWPVAPLLDACTATGSGILLGWVWVWCGGVQQCRNVLASPNVSLARCERSNVLLYRASLGPSRGLQDLSSK